MTPIYACTGYLTRRVPTVLKPSIEVRTNLFLSAPLRLRPEPVSAMSSVDIPDTNNTSPALGPAAISALPHLYVRSTLSVHRTTHAEDIELVEADNRPRPQDHKSILDAQVSGTSKSLAFRARIQFLSLCWTLFVVGWSDGSTGPLLPRIQSVYHVRFSCQTNRT